MPKVTQLVRGRAVTDLKLWREAFPCLPPAPHPMSGPSQEPFCSLPTLSPDSGGSWATAGCSVAALYQGSTACFCNHSTNFAILLQVYDVQVSARGGVMSEPILKDAQEPSRKAEGKHSKQRARLSTGKEARHSMADLSLPRALLCLSF